jgi:hypothetical protein
LVLNRSVIYRRQPFQRRNIWIDLVIGLDQALLNY